MLIMRSHNFLQPYSAAKPNPEKVEVIADKTILPIVWVNNSETKDVNSINVTGEENSVGLTTIQNFVLLA